MDNTLAFYIKCVPTVGRLLLLLRLQRRRPTRGGPSERQHPFRVGGKDLVVWRRTSKYGLSSCIEPWAPP